MWFYPIVWPVAMKELLVDDDLIVEFSIVGGRRTNVRIP
jgi:hypothetical protein